MSEWLVGGLLIKREGLWLTCVSIISCFCILYSPLACVQAAYAAVQQEVTCSQLSDTIFKCVGNGAMGQQQRCPLLHLWRPRPDEPHYLLRRLRITALPLSLVLF